MADSCVIPPLKQLDEDPFPDDECGETMHHMCREWFPVTKEQPDGGEAECTNCRLEFEWRVQFDLVGMCEDCGEPVFYRETHRCCHAEPKCTHVFHKFCGKFTFVGDPFYASGRQYCMFHKPA